LSGAGPCSDWGCVGSIVMMRVLPDALLFASLNTSFAIGCRLQFLPLVRLLARYGSAQ
jgi:hypothetical protein